MKQNPQLQLKQKKNLKQEEIASKKKEIRKLVMGRDQNNIRANNFILKEL